MDTTTTALRASNTHGIQTPHRYSIPKGEVGFADGSAVCARARALGTELFPWQRDTVRHILARDSTGRLTAKTVVLSVPRQSGKSYGIALLVIDEAIRRSNYTQVWTAHRYRVSREIFRTMRAICQRPEIGKFVTAITTATGSECIYFKNGSRILFAARERGSIRGFSKVDRLILDEAQILSADAVADMLPTMNASPDPQVIYMGTPPRPIDNGEVFTNLRTRALEGKDTRLLYLEWSAAPGCDLDDQGQWCQANPSIGPDSPFTPISRIADLRTQLASDADFAREALGMWDDVASDAVIPVELFRGLIKDRLVEAQVGTIALAVDVSPDRKWACVGLATWHPAFGTLHVEVAKHLPGTDWVIPYLQEIKGRRTIRAICIDTVGPAASLIEPARQAGLLITTLGTSQVISATANFYDRVMAGTLSHLGDAVLSSAVSGASKRVVNRDSGGWAWSRRGQTDITPLVATTMAAFGLLIAEPAAPPKAPKPKSISTTFYGFN